MKFPNFLPINGGPNAIPGKPGKYVEAPKSMMHEVADDLAPLADRRQMELIRSNNHTIGLAYARLGGQDVSDIYQSVFGRAPAVAVAPPVVDTVPTAAVAGEQAGNFWNLNDPAERRLMQQSAWAGDVAPEQADPAALRTSVGSAEEFFKEDFQMMPNHATQPAMPAEFGWTGTDQDFLQEAGIANPVVDETRVMWDDIKAMPEMTAEQHAAASQDMADNARRQLDESYGTQEDYRMAA